MGLAGHDLEELCLSEAVALEQRSDGRHGENLMSVCRKEQVKWDSCKFKGPVVRISLIKRRQWGWGPGVGDEFEKESKDKFIYDLDRNLRNLCFDSSYNGVTIDKFTYFQAGSETLWCVHLETQSFRSVILLCFILTFWPYQEGEITCILAFLKCPLLKGIHYF